MDNQRQETVSDPKELFSSGRKNSEYVKERTENLAQITEYMNQELKDYISATLCLADDFCL